MTRSLRRAPFVLALLLPIVTFIIIGRTVEIERDRPPAYVPDMGDPEDTAEIVRRAFSATKKFGLSGTSSAGAGISRLYKSQLVTVLTVSNTHPLPLPSSMYIVDPFPAGTRKTNFIPLSRSGRVPCRPPTILTSRFGTILPNAHSNGY
jgi:hypothetical protein